LAQAVFSQSSTNGLPGFRQQGAFFFPQWALQVQIIMEQCPRRAETTQQKASTPQVGVLPRAEGGSGGLCPASAEGSGSGCAKKALELHLLSGKVVHLPVQPGDNVHVIMEKAACDLQQPVSAVQLSQDGRVLQGDEPIANCSGSPIIAVLCLTLDQILSAAALDILHAMGYSTDRTTINTLDLTRSRSAQRILVDEAILAEIVENSMPSRLILSARGISIEKLAASLHRCIPTLEDVRIFHAGPGTTTMDCIISLLRSCPNLRRCSLEFHCLGTDSFGVERHEFSTEDVGRLRSLFEARITV